MSENLRPLAVSQVHTTPIGDELMVHVVGSEETHLLGATTAAVWRRCDGRTSGAELEAVFAAQPAELRPELVQLALDHLERAGLVERGGSSTDVQREHRRQFLKRAAIAAIAVPTVTTIVTATPAAAASPTGCTSNAQCPSGQVCVNGVCAACTNNAQCDAPLVCINGTCAPKSGNGGPCDEDADCTSGDCDEPRGTCRFPDESLCTSSTQCVTGCCRQVGGVNICKPGQGTCIP